MEKRYVKFFTESENWRDYPEEDGEEEPERRDPAEGLQSLSYEQRDKLYNDRILMSYLEAGIWLGRYDIGDDDDGMLEDVADIGNIHPSVIVQSKRILKSFLDKAKLLPGFKELSDLDLQHVGHDLFLSSSGAMSAFKEHDNIYGEELAYALEELVESIPRRELLDNFYLGDDGWVHAN